MSQKTNWKTVFLRSLLIFLLAQSQILAQLGGRSADEWISQLGREGRVSRLKIDEVVSYLNLKPGDNVADLGAGSGVFSGPLARSVAPEGKLFSVEIDQGLLNHIKERTEQEGLTNVHTVLGKFDDPNLPTNEIDVAFFHDVLHHIEKRQNYLKALALYLRRESRIVVIDLIKGHPKAPHRNQPQMQISLEELEGWMKKIGFSLTSKYDLFENKFFVVFSRM